MSADKHKGLAIRTAYLRLAASRGEAGFAVQVKWAYAVTSYVEDLLKLGHLRRTRQPAGSRKRVTCMVITPSGEKCLHDTLARRGQDFGPISLIRTVDPRKIRKEERRKLATEAAGYTSRRVYTGIRHLDAALAARHLERIRRALAGSASSLSTQAIA
ncbi:MULTISPECIES: hypothetical protein [Microvirga]|uniref:hypothetical protein n=1 Tax=Microvirga TaxID=186650 RepID=UPI0021C62E33|nr:MULTISPECIES: hypothetical protein [unclassified Microvirga]